MSRRKNRKQEIQLLVEESVNRAFTEGFKSVLEDISYRIGVLYDSGTNKRYGSMDLNLPMHILDGYVISDNSPIAGSIAWADCNVMYKGIKVTITNGNTNKKYVYWDYDAVPNTVFQTSDSKPTLTDDDILICTNNAGKHIMVIGEGRMPSGAILLDGTVGSTELGAGAVTTAKLASGAVTSAIIGTGAVGATQLGSGAVTSGKLGSGAVTSSAIADNAVGTTQLASNAVTSAILANNAVGATQLADGAVGSTQLADNAVGSTKLVNDAVTTDKIAPSAVTSTEIAGSAVGSTQIADGAVIGAKVGAGAIASDKLNLAMHMIF